jgi:DNA-directed RNA polymerase specialized sigma24 family protein
MKWRGIPYRLNYERLFEDWELKLAERLIRRFCGRRKAFPDSEFETLLADVLTDWYRQRSQYDAVRFNSPEAFMNTVVERDLTDRARAEMTLKRSALRNAASLNEPLNDEDNALTREEVLAIPDLLSSGVTDLRLDLGKVTRRLNSRQKRILELRLDRHAVKEIAALLNLSRSTVHDEIVRIRKLFESQGLRDYLK